MKIPLVFFKNKLTLNRIFIGYVVAGVFLAFFIPDYAIDLHFVSLISSSVPSIESLSNMSIAPKAWKGFFAVMLVLGLLSTPLLWVAVSNELKPPKVDRAGAITIALGLAIICSLLLYGMGNFIDPNQSQVAQGVETGRVIFFTRMLSSRFGLAFIGSPILAGVLALYMLATILPMQLLIRSFTNSRKIQTN